MAACEVVWLQKLLCDLDVQVDGPVVIYCENMSSIQLSRNLVFHARTKHIEMHYHFVREKVSASEIDLANVSTHEHVANIFIKALGVEKLQIF